MKELFQDLIVGIAFKNSGLGIPILVGKETKMKERSKEIRGAINWKNEFKKKYYSIIFIDIYDRFLQSYRS